MVYSLWNWDTQRYDYYRDDSGPKLGQPIVARSRAKYGGGDSVRPEDVLTILPDEAIKIGSGDAAQGRLAVRKEEAALGQAVSQGGISFSTLLMVAGVGYMLYRFSR